MPAHPLNNILDGAIFFRSPFSVANNEDMDFDGPTQTTDP